MLSVATMAAQLFAVINLLILTRVYSQFDIGVYSVFISYSLIASAVILLSYEVIIPNLEEQDLGCFISGILLLVLFLCTAVTLVCIFSGYSFALALPVQIAAIGLIRLSEMVNIRNGAFRVISFARLAPHGVFLLAIIVFLSGGDATVYQLITTHTLSFASIALLYSMLTLARHLEKGADFPRIMRLFLKNKRQPLFVMPSELMNNLAQNLPVIIIERFISTETAAQYAIILRLCMGPISILGSTIANVYHGDLAKSIRTHSKDAYRQFLSIRRYLAGAGIAVGICIALVFPPVIELLIGPEWKMAGQFGIILSPLFLVMVIVMPLAVSFYVFEQQSFLFMNQLFYLLISLLAFGSAALVDNIWIGVALFSALSVLRYLVMLLKINKLSKERLQ